MRKISACIVSYNGADEVIRAVESLLKYTKDCALTVYLVDNASPDGTGEPAGPAPNAPWEASGSPPPGLHVPARGGTC